MVEKRKNHEESRGDVAQNCKSDPDAVTVSISPAITNLIKFRWTSFLRGLDGNSWQVVKSKICLSKSRPSQRCPRNPGAWPMDVCTMSWSLRSEGVSWEHWYPKYPKRSENYGELEHPK